MMVYRYGLREPDADVDSGFGVIRHQLRRANEYKNALYEVEHKKRDAVSILDVSIPSQRFCIWDSSGVRTSSRREENSNTIPKVLYLGRPEWHGMIFFALRSNAIQKALCFGRKQRGKSKKHAQ